MYEYIEKLELILYDAKCSYLYIELYIMII